MKRVAGVLILLAALYAGLFAANPNAASASTLTDLANRQGFNGVLVLSAGLVILAGGIDLSLGSVVALAAILFGVLMQTGVPPYLAALVTVFTGTLIGAAHGLLINGLRLQAFLVTLCGMFVYRGLARLLTGDRQFGLEENLYKTIPGVPDPTKHPEFRPAVEGMQYALLGQDSAEFELFPATLVVFLLLALVVGVVLHFTVYGRYWYAIGFSEQAARYAGVRVGRHRVAVFALASSLAAFAGVLLMLKSRTAKPDAAGMGLELEAITGAVIGGVALRGGEGTVPGMMLGAAVLPVVVKMLSFYRISDAAIPVIVGGTLFAGALADELIRRRRGGRG